MPAITSRRQRKKGRKHGASSNNLTGKRFCGTMKTTLATKRGNEKKNTNKSKCNHYKLEMYKIGVWNIRSINGKENELIQEFKNTKLDLLGMCETKKKGRGIMKMEERLVLLLYSGIDKKMRAKEGVAC